MCHLFCNLLLVERVGERKIHSVSAVTVSSKHIFTWELSVWLSHFLECDITHSIHLFICFLTLLSHCPQWVPISSTHKITALCLYASCNGQVVVCINVNKNIQYMYSGESFPANNILLWYYVPMQQDVTMTEEKTNQKSSFWLSLADVNHWQLAYGGNLYVPVPCSSEVIPWV